MELFNHRERISLAVTTIPKCGNLGFIFLDMREEDKKFKA